MIIRSKAKINLFLKIYGKNDKYHFLHSLIAFCDDIYDELDITLTENINNKLKILASEFSLHLPVENNILLKVLKFASTNEKFLIKLKKNMPVSSGIGGGSSNAAVLLNYLLKNYKCLFQKLDLSLIATSLGSDVPVCLKQRASYISSFGEQVQEIKLPTNIWAVLVNPKIEVSTSEVFKGFNLNNSYYHKKSPNFKTSNEVYTFLKGLDNDLENEAIKILPQISFILSTIAKTENCILARMSGSGATCFGLFNSKIDAIKAKKQLLENNHNWWIKETLLI